MKDFMKIGGRLLEKRQPFGNVDNEYPMAGPGRPPEHLNVPLGPLTMRGNNGGDHGPTFADKNPGSQDEACAHTNEPFYWTKQPGRFNPRMKYNEPERGY